VIFACRTVIYLATFTQLIYHHAFETFTAYKRKSTMNIACVRLPLYLEDWQESASLMLAVTLMLMLILEPILWCWDVGASTETLFVEECDAVSNLNWWYSVASAIGMVLYFALSIDLTVFSNRVSAFVLVCGQMLVELGLFVFAGFMGILLFSSACSVVKHDAADFAGIPPGALSLLRMTLGMFPGARFDAFEKNPVILVLSCIFLISICIFMLNMLIAQLTCAYDAIYSNMVGYARLSRMEIVVETIPSVTKQRWWRFHASMALDQKIEFGEGDIGVSGGIQVREPANLNPTVVDMIKRFGGSTEASAQWPEEEGEGEGEDRYERIEKLIQRTLKRINESGQSGGGKASSGMGGSGMGSGAGGSGGGSGVEEGED
jgi:uncharacterized membrane protein YgcG